MHWRDWRIDSCSYKSIEKYPLSHRGSFCIQSTASPFYLSGYTRHSSHYIKDLTIAFRSKTYQYSRKLEESREHITILVGAATYKVHCNGWLHFILSSSDTSKVMNFTFHIRQGSQNDIPQIGEENTNIEEHKTIVIDPLPLLCTSQERRHVTLPGYSSQAGLNQRLAVNYSIQKA